MLLYITIYIDKNLIDELKSSLDKKTSEKAAMVKPILIYVFKPYHATKLRSLLILYLG
jgi:hypothetical protein